MSVASILGVYNGQEPDLCFGSSPGPGGVNSVGVGAGLAQTGSSANPIVSLGMSAVGDLLVGTGVANSGAVLGKGANGNFLRVKTDGSGLEYTPVVPGGGVNSVNEAPNNVGFVNNANVDAPLIGIAFDNIGDLVVGLGANTGEILPKGANGNFLRVKTDGSGLEYAAVAPGGVDSVSAVASNVGLVLTTGAGSPTDPKIGLAFSAVGDLPVGTGASTGTFLPKGANGNFLRVKTDGSGLEYAAVAPGGVDSVSAVASNVGLVLTTGAGSPADPKIGLAFLAKGDLAVGTGASTGVFLSAPQTADLVLTSAPTEPSGMKWEAAGSGSSATIFRNNTATALPISKPQTANDTCVIVSDEVFGVPINTQVYDQQGQTGTTDILTNPGFYDWAIGPGNAITTDALINLIVLDFEITASAAAASASCILVGPLPLTTTLATFTFQVPVIPTGTNLVQTSYSGADILLAAGETYQIKLLITPTNPGDTFTWRGTTISDYAGFFSVEGTGKGGGPAQFSCPALSSFRLPGVNTTHPLATCDTNSSQSFVASANLLDWILVGALNTGVLIP